jgi:type IV fimbrial biogenesis protein FimT
MERRGFTLVELLVVLAVGSILLAIALPGYGFLANTNRLTAATNSLVSALHYARSESIKRGERITVCTTSNPAAPTPSCDHVASWHQGWLVFKDGGVRGVMDYQDELLRIEQDVLLDNMTITATNFSHYVSYLPNGMSQGPNHLGNGIISFCLEHMENRVILSITGRIRLAKGNC